MTIHDLDILNRCHDEAIAEMSSAAVAIAEAVSNSHRPSKEDVERYKIAKLGVEATRRDLEYCVSLELNEILDT